MVGFIERTMLALWKSRSLSPEQKVQLVEEESDTKSLNSEDSGSLNNEDSGSFIGMDDVMMSEVFSCSLPLNVSLYIRSCLWIEQLHVLCSKHFMCRLLLF